MELLLSQQDACGGCSSEIGSAVVGAAATSAVVSGITAIIIADSVFTMIFNALGM